LAAVLARKGGVLVVDEAFADLEGPGVSVAPLLPCPGLVVLRSFGKTYGLAGVRLGFLLAAPEVGARVRGALGPWAVSGPALAVGARALGDVAWLEAAAVRLAGDGARLELLLAGAGLRAVGGTRLFRLFEAEDAGAVCDRLGRRGILVRCFGGALRWVRFGLPIGPEGWTRLQAAL
jgi:cobalamin biosynthetic protein CobC